MTIGKRSLVGAAMLAWLAAVTPSRAAEAGASRPAQQGGVSPGGESLGQKIEDEVARTAGGPGGQSSGASGTLATVLGWLHRTNTTAVEGGRLGEEKATSSKVKAVAQKLVGDHAALEQEVLALAKARGIQLPGGSGSAAAGAGAASKGLAALEKLKGSAFDSAFLKWVSGTQQRDAKQARSQQDDAAQAGEPALAALLEGGAAAPGARAVRPAGAGLRRAPGALGRGRGRVALRSVAAPRRGAAFAACTAALLAACGAPARGPSTDACPAEAPARDPAAAAHAIKTVFVVVLENQDWASIRGSPSAPFINGALLPRFAHAERYRNGGVHPSLGNYVALEAGDPLGIHFDAPPADVPLPTRCHLATYLDAVGLSWKAYEEGIAGDACPVADAPPYAVRHDPFVYFEDVAGAPPSPGSARCIAHVRPYAELARDLAAGTVAAYNFITPDLCDSGHDACAPLGDPVRQSDAWLARELPAIMASRAYQDGGVILVTWDEGASGDEPIGLIAVSPLAKPGYAGNVAYSHASTLRTVQEVLGVTPLLRRAAAAESLADLFTAYP